MLQAAEFLGQVGIGVTSPCLFRGSDGETYVVKLQANRLGPVVLANEQLAAALGEKLGLCFPESRIIELDAGVIGRSRGLRQAGYKPGRQFACRFLPHSVYLNRARLQKAINKQQMAGVLLFDHLLFNPDRTKNRRNLLIRREAEGARIYAIDNSHLFMRGRWSADTLAKLAGRVMLNTRRSYGILLKHYLQPEDFSGYVAAIQGLTTLDFTNILDSIPWEWLPSGRDRDALLTFLVKRRDMTEEICRKICELIPVRVNPA